MERKDISEIVNHLSYLREWFGFVIAPLSSDDGHPYEPDFYSDAGKAGGDCEDGTRVAIYELKEIRTVRVERRLE